MTLLDGIFLAGMIIVIACGIVVLAVAVADYRARRARRRKFSEWGR